MLGLIPVIGSRLIVTEGFGGAALPLLSPEAPLSTVLPISFVTFILTKTLLANLYRQLGMLRYSVFLMLLLCALSLPIKMLCRWLFNLKYIVSIPEFFLNI